MTNTGPSHCSGAKTKADLQDLENRVLVPEAGGGGGLKGQCGLDTGVWVGGMEVRGWWGDDGEGCVEGGS